jgi:hypothetical protein
MKADFEDTRERPCWVRSGRCRALIVRCAACLDHRGSRYSDGSGICEGCEGSGWKLLAKNIAVRDGA